MPQDKEIVAAALHAMAASAKLLALDFERDRLWEGDLSRRLREIKQHFDTAWSGVPRNEY